MNSLQKSAYRLPQWKEFSRKVIEEHQCQCSRCNRHESEGITLQVHHTYYDPDRFHKPWDYPLKDLEVLCKGCHAREHGHIMPMDGWEHIDMEDMQEPCVECEYPNCTYEGLLRYVHTVYHPKWGYLNVGCGHSDKLTGTSQASELEKAAKSRQTKFDGFLKETKWQQNGQRWYRKYVDFPITITQSQDAFYITIFIPLPEAYQTLHEAKKAAFNICYNQTQQQFFQQHNIPYSDNIQRKPRTRKNPVIYRNQLTFAISNQTGLLVHIDSVEPNALCNCICPACQQPVKADNTSDLPNNHRFVHLINSTCEDSFLQMYRHLTLQLIKENKQLLLPEYSNDEAELYIPSVVVGINSVLYSTSLYDAIVTCLINDTEQQIAIIVDLGGTLNNENIQSIKSSKIPTIRISLVKPHNITPPLKKKELQELLRTDSSIISWIHSPHLDKQATQLLQNKQLYLNQLEDSIQQAIDNCIYNECEITQIERTYLNHRKYPHSVERLFSDTIDKTIKRIIKEPSEEDLRHTEQCTKFIQWYMLYDTIYGINYNLLYILRVCNFFDLSKQNDNHTTQMVDLLYNLFGYYFQNEKDYLWANDSKLIPEKIRKNIRNRFFKNNCSLIQRTTSNDCITKISAEQKNGMELYFLLYLFYGVKKIDWHEQKKKRMFHEISNKNNRPIFAAIGSLWFGHIFNRFQTDDLQAFIHVIATKYSKAAPWVLTYIEHNTDYKQFCLQKNISYAELEPLRDSYHNIWLDGIFYSALPSNDLDTNKTFCNDLFPKVSLPKIYY